MERERQHRSGNAAGKPLGHIGGGESRVGPVEQRLDLAGVDPRMAGNDRQHEARFVLAVVPGHARVDTGKVKALFNGTYAGFAATDVAEDRKSTRLNSSHANI